LHVKYSPFQFGLIGTETRIFPYLLGVMHLIVMQHRLIGSVIPLAERDVNKRRCWCDWIWQEEVCGPHFRYKHPSLVYSDSWLTGTPFTGFPWSSCVKSV